MAMFVMFRGKVYSVEGTDGDALYLLDEDGGMATATLEQVDVI